MKKSLLLDRAAIDRRFFICFEGETPTDIARCFAVTPPTVFQWLSGHRHVPWDKLRHAVDVKGVSWDWLLDDVEPIHRKGGAAAGSPVFDWEAIGKRFLSLFPGMSQAELAHMLEVTPGAISSWRNNRRHIPWDRLKWATLTKGVTWEWLLDGR